MIFGIKEKSLILTHTVSVLLAIATDSPVQLVTGLVIQSHTFAVWFGVVLLCMCVLTSQSVFLD